MEFSTLREKIAYEKQARIAKHVEFEALLSVAHAKGLEAGLTNICTSAEVIRSFETFMLKQFTYTIDELRVLPMYHKACLLVIDDVDYWADKSFWALYDEASL